MKVRKNFVSNSSSSSFVVPLAALTKTQIALILEHQHYAQDIYKYYGKNSVEVDLAYAESDAWNVSIEGENLTGWTSMDNFCMELWMQEIGVPLEKVEWDSGYHIWYDHMSEEEKKEFLG